MGSVDPPRRPPTAGIVRLEAFWMLCCSRARAFDLAACPTNFDVEWNDAMKLEVLGAGGHGRMTLSNRSVRRYPRLKLLSNSLPCVERALTARGSNLLGNVGGHDVLVRLACVEPIAYHPPKPIDVFDLKHRLLVVLSSSSNVVGLNKIPAGVQTLT